MTEEERKIAGRFFESMEPLKLRNFPAKDKFKDIVARCIAEKFAVGRKYTEFEVKEVLAPICEDHATVRRYMIDHGLLSRTKDCSEYWREEPAGE